ncbi:hypothetical protein [Nostoc sp. WHI]|uniref:hypothetical protein n=1 Tax=Nostoc sp. WHI TaxID=2650611 RepID=UPI003FA5CB04
MILVTEAQIGNWETYALRKSRKVALQYFETEWVATTLQVLGGLKVVLYCPVNMCIKVATTLQVLGGLKVVQIQ